MSKHFFTKLLIALAWLAAAVLWLLSVIKPDTFGFFNINWAIVVICGTAGIAFLFRGLGARKTGILKKSDIFLGALLLIIAAVSVIFALSLPKSYIWPIIAVIIALAAVISVVAVGGKNGTRAIITAPDTKITAPAKRKKKRKRNAKTKIDEHYTLCFRARPNFLSGGLIL